MIITIDGPSASGKGTLARRLAQHYGLPHLDTGALYRAVGAQMLAQDIDPRDGAAAAAMAERFDQAWLERLDLRMESAADAASIVAAEPGVRAALLAYQRNFAGQPGGAVLDGRDTGTVVCPEADVKLFLTASAEVRARRRAAELTEARSYDQVLADLQARDARDRDRATAPLRPAEDALLLDGSDLDIDQSVAQAIRLIDEKRRLRSSGS